MRGGRSASSRRGSSTRPSGCSVRFDDDSVCAPMPALIFMYDAFRPMWEEPRARVTESEVCVPAPGDGVAVIRVGHGFGRRGTDEYYLVDFSKRVVVKLRKSAVKEPGGWWMVCLHLPPGAGVPQCYKWINGRLAPAPKKY